MKTNHRLRHGLLFLILLLLAATRAAADSPPPESGWWWNADQSGRGYQIEVQDQYLMLSAYAYDPDGEAVFYTAAALYNGGIFTAPVIRTSQGQCFNCPYRKPVETVVGTVTIDFTTPSSANMTFLGEAIPISRYAPAEYLAQVPDVVLGEWATIDGDTTAAVYSGERLTFDSLLIASDGLRTAQGYRTGDLLAHALASWDPASKSIVILLDSSSSFYETWVLSYGGFNRLHGLRALYPKNSSPTAWVGSLASRLNFRYGARWNSTLGGPPPLTPIPLSNDRDEIKRQQSISVEQSGSAQSPSPGQLRLLQRLQVQMQALRVKWPARDTRQ